jgi:hypothetical protein
LAKGARQQKGEKDIYSENSIHRFCRGSEKEAMDLGKQ